MPEYITIGKRTKFFVSEWQNAKWRALFDDNRISCEVPGCNMPAEDAHHALFSRDTNCEYLDDYRNLAMVCHKHNVDRTADEAKYKPHWLRIAVKYNGAPAVREFLENVPERKQRGKEHEELLRMLVRQTDGKETR